MFNDQDTGLKVSYWPSVSDLFLTLFIITVALLSAVILVFLPERPKDDYIVVSEIIEPINKLREQLIDLKPLDDNVKSSDVFAALREMSDSTKSIFLAYREQIDKLISGDKSNVEEVIELQLHNSRLQVENNELQIEKDKAQAEYNKLLRHIPEIYVPKEELARIKQDLDRNRTEADLLKNKLATIEIEKDMRLEDKPPIITIADADKRHFFASGSAAVSPDFVIDLDQGSFKEIAAEIIRRNKSDVQTVDTLEIIGHTDGIPVARRGNLDSVLPEILGGIHDDFRKLSPGSNNDLGLLRALAIKQAWLDFVAVQPPSDSEKLAAISVRTYSAGQTIPVDSANYRAEDARSRRIELRLTKLH